MSREDLINGIAKRTYRNKNCAGDCTLLTTLALTQCNPGPVCGEGEFGIAVKCDDCKAIYFEKVYTFGGDISIIDSLFATRYKGDLEESVLISRINAMFQSIDLKKLNRN